LVGEVLILGGYGNFCKRIAAALLMTVGVAFGQPADYAEWLQAVPGRAEQVQSFEQFLANEDVGGVLPTDQLLLNATDWKRCKLEAPYTLAPRTLWPHLVATLKFVRDEIVPAIGQVEAESGYREAKLNLCAGGAPKSAHALFYALDLVPTKPMTQPNLISALCKLHRERGSAYYLGLGFYGGLRFHVDTKGFRLWGSDYHSGSSPCLRAPPS